MKHNYRFLISGLALIGLLSTNAHEQKHLQYNTYANQDTTQCPLCHDVISVHDAHACVDQLPNHSYAPDFFSTPIMNPNHSLYPFHSDTRNFHNTPQLSIAPYIAPHYPSNQHPVQPTVTNFSMPPSTSADFDDFIITCEFCGVEIESYNTHICPVQNYPDASHNTPNYPNTPPTNLNPPTHAPATHARDLFHHQLTENFATGPQHHQPIEESSAHACSNPDKLQALPSSPVIDPNEYLTITCADCNQELECFYNHSCPARVSQYTTNDKSTPPTNLNPPAHNLIHQQSTEPFKTCPQCHQHLKESDAHACSNQMPNHQNNDAIFSDSHCTNSSTDDDSSSKEKRRKKEIDNCSVITLELSENIDTNTQNILNILSEQKQLAKIPDNKPLTEIEFTTLTQHQNKNIIYNSIENHTKPFYQSNKCILPECPDKDKIFKDYIDFLDHFISTHTNLTFHCPIEACTFQYFNRSTIQMHYQFFHKINRDSPLCYWFLEKKERISLRQFYPNASNTQQILDMLSQQQQWVRIPPNNSLISLELSEDINKNTQQILDMLSQQKQLARIPHNTPLGKAELEQLTNYNKKIIYNCIKNNAMPFYQKTKCILPGCPDKDKTFNDSICFLNHFIEKHTNLVFKCPIEPCKTTQATSTSIQRHFREEHTDLPHDTSLLYWLLQKKEKNSLLQLSANTHNNTEQILNMLSQQKQLARIPHNTPLTKEEFTTLTEHQNTFIIYNCIRENAIPFYQNTKCTLPGCPEKDKTFKKPKDFLTHFIEKHTNLAFKCPIEPCKTIQATSTSIQRHFREEHTDLPHDTSLLYWLLQKKEKTLLLRFSADTDDRTEQILNMLSQQKQFAKIPDNKPLTLANFEQLTKDQNKSIIYEKILKYAQPFYQNNKCILRRCPDEDKTFRNLQTFLDHFISKHTNLAFKCPIEACHIQYFNHSTIQMHCQFFHKITKDISLFYWWLQKEKISPLQLSHDAHSNTEQILNMIYQQKHLADIPNNRKLTLPKFEILTKHDRKPIIYSSIEEHTKPFYQSKKCVLQGCADKDKTFKDYKDFLNHFIPNHTNLEFKCPIAICKKTSFTDELILEHYTKNHRMTKIPPEANLFYWFLTQVATSK